MKKMVLCDQGFGMIKICPYEISQVEWFVEILK